jgi:hypothetical protein
MMFTIHTNIGCSGADTGSDQLLVHPPFLDVIPNLLVQLNNKISLFVLQENCQLMCQTQFLRLDAAVAQDSLPTG